MIAAYGVFRLRCKGVVCGKSCIIQGVPFVKMKRGSRITLGNDVTLCSMQKFNPMVVAPCRLRTSTANGTIEIGNHCGISGALIMCASHISIGDYTLIGAGTTIMDMSGHTYSKETGWAGHAKRTTASPISIGSKCFIGAACMIQPGVTIGDSCVISAGTIVNQDIPAGHRAFGNPLICEPLPKALGGPGRKKKIQPAD